MKYYVLTNSSPPKGESGESCGSKYDLSHACKNCGTGAELTGPLYTKKLKRIKENFIFTLDGDLLVSDQIYSAFVKENIDIPQMVSVIDSNGDPLPLHHFNSKLSFPKLLPQSEGLKVEDQCPVCRQNGYFNEVVIGDLKKGIATYVMPLTFHYGDIDEDFLNQSDIFHTWEHMGLSNLRAEGNKVIRYARPLLIVSEKVKKVLESFKLKKLFFKEVIIHSVEVQ